MTEQMMPANSAEVPKKKKQWKKSSTIMMVALVVALGLGAILALKYADKIPTFLGISALPPVGQGATLKVTPSVSSITQNGTFTATVTMDAGTNAALSAGAYLTFDPTKLSVTSVTTTGSAFSLFIESAAQRFDNTAGTISLSAGTPAPGVTGNGKLIATINFQAKTVAGAAAINFNYGGTRNSGTSQVVVIDAGSASDILDSVQNASVTVQAALPAAPVVTIDPTYAKYSTKLRATWVLSDASVTTYQYRVLKADGTQVYPATAGTYANAGLVTAFTIDAGGTTPGLNLTNGTQYKVAVRGVNGTGNGTEGVSGLITTASTNLDHSVPESVGPVDFAQLATGWGLTTKPMSDINQDGKVDVRDLALFAIVYNTTL